MSTWRLHHDWHDGARINGARLATCRACGTLRATSDAGAVYVRRVEDETERVRTIEPPCVAPTRRQVPKSEAQQQAFAFLEAMRARVARHVPATAAQRAEAFADEVTCERCGIEQRAALRCALCGWHRLARSPVVP